MHPLRIRGGDAGGTRSRKSVVDQRAPVRMESSRGHHVDAPGFERRAPVDCVDHQARPQRHQRIERCTEFAVVQLSRRDKRAAGESKYHPSGANHDEIRGVAGYSASGNQYAVGVRGIGGAECDRGLCARVERAHRPQPLDRLRQRVLLARERADEIAAPDSTRILHPAQRKHDFIPRHRNAFEREHLAREYPVAGKQKLRSFTFQKSAFFTVQESAAPLSFFTVQKFAAPMSPLVVVTILSRIRSVAIARALGDRFDKRPSAAQARLETGAQRGVVTAETAVLRSGCDDARRVRVGPEQPQRRETIVRYHPRRRQTPQRAERVAFGKPRPLRNLIEVLSTAFAQNAVNGTFLRVRYFASAPYAHQRIAPRKKRNLRRQLAGISSLLARHRHPYNIAAHTQQVEMLGAIAVNSRRENGALPELWSESESPKLLDHQAGTVGAGR